MTRKVIQIPKNNKNYILEGGNDDINIKSSKGILIKTIVNSNKAFRTCKANGSNSSVKSITKKILENSSITSSDKNYLLQNIISQIFNGGITQYESTLNDIIDSLKPKNNSESLSVSKSSLLIFIIDKANLYNNDKTKIILEKISTDFGQYSPIKDYLIHTNPQKITNPNNNQKKINQNNTQKTTAPKTNTSKTTASKKTSSTFTNGVASILRLVSTTT